MFGSKMGGYIIFVHIEKIFFYRRMFFNDYKYILIVIMRTMFKKI
jgi:hypothetical protein